MSNEWNDKFNVAIAERNPIMQSLRITEAFEAIIQRIEELEELGLPSNGEIQKLVDAIEHLKHLRDLSLDRPA
jgi:hypothetical protein